MNQNNGQQLIYKGFKGYLGLSGKTGEGVNDLMDQIKIRLDNYFNRSGSACNGRHRNAMRKANMALDLAKKNLVNEGMEVELVAEDVRQAILNLEGLLGKVDIEEVYGEIFSRFCIGK